MCSVPFTQHNRPPRPGQHKVGGGESKEAATPQKNHYQPTTENNKGEAMSNQPALLLIRLRDTVAHPHTGKHKSPFKPQENVHF